MTERVPSPLYLNGDSQHQGRESVLQVKMHFLYLAILPSDNHESSLHRHRLSRQNFLERTPDLQYQTLSPEKRGILMTHPSPSLLLSALHDLPPHWPLHITCSHISLRWDLQYLVPLTCQNGPSCQPRLIQSLSIVTAKRCLSALTVSGL